MYFHVRQGELGPWRTVHVVGEVDLATAPRYRSELISASTGASALAVDLTDCDLIDSIGLGVTLGAARRVWSAGGAFAVIASAGVQATFARCRLDEILDIVPDLAALTAPGAGAGR